MKSLRILLVFLLVPGTIVFALPLFLGIKAFPNEHAMPAVRYLGVLSWVSGGLIVRWCARAFFTIGKGSPSPIDPPVVLVTSGLFNVTRNPMYVGGILIVLGHCLFFQTGYLAAYLVFVFLLFHCIVIFYEEPHLRRQFGEAYEQYCQQVPRWFIRPVHK